MTWKDYNIATYMAGQKRIKMVNESRKQAQRLLMLQSKRANPKLHEQVNDNRRLLTKKRK
jgi:hypothetical protein